VSSTPSRGAPSTAKSAKADRAHPLVEDVYTVGRDTQINGVVSPGNQAGGLANILEKSLGSSMKGGTGPLIDVYKYAEPVTKKGFRVHGHARLRSLLATGQIAGGANMIAFTTGRGSMFGASRCPQSSWLPTRDVRKAHRGHGHQLRHHPRRQEHDFANGPADFRRPAALRFGRADKSELARPGRPRVRAVDNSGVPAEFSPVANRRPCGGKPRGLWLLY